MVLRFNVGLNVLNTGDGRRRREEEVKATTIYLHNAGWIDKGETTD